MSTERNETKIMPKQILLSILTAVLAAILSVIGFYFTSKIQAKNDKTQKQFEYKVMAYQSFLTSVSKTQSPIIAEILSVGKLEKHVVTDGEIQGLKDSFAKLSKLNVGYPILWQLDNDFNILRLHGSETVRQDCDDILAVLAFREDSVDWKRYPKELQTFRQDLLKRQNGVAYGFELRVSDDERVMYILLSSLYNNLLSQLRTELQN